MAKPCHSLAGIQPRNDVSSPHPGPLPQGARGSDRKPLRLHGRPQTKTAA